MHSAEAFAQLALALPAASPPPSLRARLLDAAKPPRLQAMIAKLATLFDVSRPRARQLLDRLDDPAAWLPGPVPNTWVMMAEGGPKLEGAFCGFVKMGASVRWPRHRHLGTEEMLILEGGFRQDDGDEVHPGDLHVMEIDTTHGFTIFDDEPCVSAAVVRGGVSFEDPSLQLGDLSK
jgi:putative transcriptional regulator